MKQLRGGLVRLGVLGFLLFIVGAFGSQAPNQVVAAGFAMLTGAAMITVLGSIIAWTFAPTYEEDAGHLTRRLHRLWPYVLRGGSWSLAGAGIGALLATALPSRLTDTSLSPTAIPTSGWLSILTGAIGLAVGILEEWRQDETRRGGDPPAGPSPKGSATETGPSDDA